jgi:hypothetical protein
MRLLVRRHVFTFFAAAAVARSAANARPQAVVEGVDVIIAVADADADANADADAVAVVVVCAYARLTVADAPESAAALSFASQTRMHVVVNEPGLLTLVNCM